MQIVRVDEDAVGKWQIGLRVLDFDTKLFGFTVACLDPFISPGNKGTVSPAGKAALESCLKAAREAKVRQISVSVKPDDVVGMRLLSDHGFRFADTILAFQLDLQKAQLADLDLAGVREGKTTDIDAGAAISAECFGNREYNVNRFNSDPIFPEAKVRELYDTWARNSFNGQAADKVFVCEDSGQIAGFITCKVLKDGTSLGTIPLNAVDPAHHGKGIYKKLVRAGLLWLAENGATTAEIRTQITNTAVHRTWENLGGHLAFAYHRFHLSL